MNDIYDLLPFVLHPDNIAHYEDGVVLIGDRRKYPLQKSFVRCESVEEVARAIEQMVTQGAGPWQAASCALALAGRVADGFSAENANAHMQTAAARLIATRPTNTALARRIEKAMVAITSRPAGASIEATALDWLSTHRQKIYTDYAARARYGADLIADGDGVLTMCFAETAFILALAFAKQDGKKIHAYVPETRPWLQGAKLTAPSIHELDIPVTLITDNMAAALMAQGKINKYFTAADLVTLDGHIANKVGTFQLAIVANYHNIPFFVMPWGFDPTRRTRDDIDVEERDPDDIKTLAGQQLTDPEIEAYYPAFDITPPHLVAGVVTHHGVYSPYDLERAAKNE